MSNLRYTARNRPLEEPATVVNIFGFEAIAHQVRRAFTSAIPTLLINCDAARSLTHFSWIFGSLDMRMG